MKPKNLIFALTVVAIAVIGCKSKTSAPSADGLGFDFPEKPVAERVATEDGGEVISLDINSLKESVNVPLSSLAESIEIIPLDSRNEALFAYGNVVISDNYILIMTSEPRSVKLFDRKGNYLRDIGHEGRGPGEYMMLYSAAIDEKNETIYVMPWMTDQLLAFGIDGTPKEPVKLAHNSPKGVFNVNADGTFSIAIVPVGDASVWAWTQDAEGNVVNEIANPKAGQPIDFSSEIGAGKNNGEFDPFLMMFGNKDNDTLGRYNTQTGAMEPLFTVSNIQSKEPPYYSYTQLPRHFIGNYAPGMEQVSENTSVATAPINFIVDRETLRGAPYVLTIDELGGLGAWPNFTQGYFIGNWPAINLKKDLEKLLSSGDVTDPAMIERVTALNDSLDDEDNNILILARLRK